MPNDSFDLSWFGPAMSKILGQDKVTGQPMVDPQTGEIVGQYQGSKGLFGAGSRRQAEAMNNQLQREKMLADLERYAAREAVNNKILAEQGITADPYSLKDYSAGNIFRTGARNKKDQAEDLKSFYEVEAAQTPEARIDAINAYRSKLRAPITAEDVARKVEVRPGENVYMGNRQYTGMIPQEKLVNVGGFPDPKDPTKTIGGTQEVVRNMLPSNVRTFTADPSIVNQYIKGIGGGQTSYPSVDRFLQGGSVDEFLGTQPSASSVAPQNAAPQNIPAAIVRGTPGFGSSSWGEPAPITVGPQTAQTNVSKILQSLVGTNASPEMIRQQQISEQSRQGDTKRSANRKAIIDFFNKYLNYGNY